MPITLTSESVMKDFQALCERLGLEVKFVGATDFKYEGKWIKSVIPMHAKITEPCKSRFFGIRRHRDVAYLEESVITVNKGYKKEPELLAGLKQIYSHHSGLPEERLQDGVNVQVMDFDLLRIVSYAMSG